MILIFLIYGFFFFFFFSSSFSFIINGCVWVCVYLSSFLSPLWGFFFSSTCLSFIILVIVTWDREGKMVEIRILAEGGKGGDNGGKGPREKEGEERK